ncbi:MAG: O-antigen ligase family protein [Hydrogenophilaceae bacterium]|nr:O-antigen ligase family protein [Hydrogenophilaceae bacterium]
MPEHIKALIVILVLSFFVFGFARAPALNWVERVDYDRRRNLWLGLTTVAFLAHNFWLYALSAILLLVLAGKQDNNRVAVFFLAMLVLPPIAVDIPGFGLINILFSLNHVRLLTLAILLPMFMGLLHRTDIAPIGRPLADKLLIAYLILVVLLQLRETTVTDTLRQAFYVFIDAFIPYIVISRSLKELKHFREALSGFVLAALVLAAICLFEAAKHWQLYRAVSSALGAPLDTLSIVERGGILRAMGSTGHPIVAGYVMTVTLGFFLFLKNSLPNKQHQRFGLALISAGLVAPLSRGPWVGAGLMLVTYLATGPFALRRLAVLAFAGLMAIPLLSVLPGGEKVLNLLPFIGTVETNTIDYRAQLLDAAYKVMMRDPWFGSVDFALAPEMQAMIQGRGIIDIVNTYLLISLRSGFVGLGLFVGFFALIAWNLFRTLQKLADKNSELHLLGRSLFASLVAILAIIFTVSDISVIPTVYWSLAGLGVAYVAMIQTNIDQEPGGNQ